MKTSLFDPYPALPQKSDSISRHWKLREAVKQLTERLKDFQQQLDSQSERELAEDDCGNAVTQAEDGPTIFPQSFTRRVVLSTNQPLDIPSIMDVNELYHVESRALEASQDLIIHCMLDDVGFSDETTLKHWELPHLLNAYHKEVRRTTDRWTDANEETAHLADTPAPAGRSVELDFAELLEDFFRICQGPNKAEVLMLSTVCQESAAWVKQWFIERRTQTVWLRRKVDPRQRQH